MMRVGLVELHVDLGGRPTSEIRDAIAADHSREEKVRAAIQDARAKSCNMVLFPGWTLVTDRVPAWLRTASKGCTVVFECVPPGQSGSKTMGKGGDDPAFDGLFHVLHDGRPAVRPVQQVLAQAGQVAKHGVRLVEQLADPKARRWRERTHEALLLACGEVNLVSGGGRSSARWERRDLVASSVRGGRLVLNPAHTPTTLPAMRHKRAWLSGAGGWLLMTANVYTARPRSAHRGAVAWRNGKRVELEEPDLWACDSGFAVHVVTVE
jgi:hypothetical protein